MGAIEDQMHFASDQTSCKGVVGPGARGPHSVPDCDAELPCLVNVDEQNGAAVPCTTALAFERGDHAELALAFDRSLHDAGYDRRPPRLTLVPPQISDDEVVRLALASTGLRRTAGRS